MTDRRVPTSTYRLQLHAGFGFSDAASIVPYLARLGISHLYLSPILQAAPGSLHGYDVVDHSRVSVDLGGEDGLRRLADVAHEHDMGIVVDVVPNHMAVPTPEYLNPQLWETLRLGRDSRTAHWFDVEWDRNEGRLSLAILGDSLDEVTAAGEITLGEHGGDPALVYADHVLPLVCSVETSDIEDLLEHQHYLLTGWREAPQVLNYRRFFDVTTLIAIRVELDDVFDATHAKLLELHAAAIIDGFRIDHPDGLADPQGYLERLRDKSGGAWVVVEKILEPGERLPPMWPTAGSTGYDAIRAIQTALVPHVGEDLGRRWESTGGEPSYDQVELGSKRLVIADLFGPEVRRLARAAVTAARESGRPLDRDATIDALSQLLSHVDVYRSYVRLDSPVTDEAHEGIAGLAEQARRTRPDLTATIDVLSDLLMDSTSTSASGRDLVVRFQQVCGPVMAKGVEDTTFYRFHRLVGLNEVGGDPRTLDDPTPSALHTWAKTQASDYPQGMTSLSTHDTKRNEDVRARLLAAPENLDGWDEVVAAVRSRAASCDVDAPTAYLVAQTLIGVWPITAHRLQAYLEKAVREAKQYTTWNDPNPSYEKRVVDLALGCLEGGIAATLQRIVVTNAEAVRATTLATKLIQLTLPGVPDVYQGSELAEPSLVDPDNRRPVDYDRRANLLVRLDEVVATKGDGDGDLDAEKLWVTSRALRLRRGHPEYFDAGAGYMPMTSDSPHLLGFLRAGRVATLVTRWPGLLSRQGWQHARAELPAGGWVDVLSGRSHEVGDGGLVCAELFEARPVSLLVKEVP